VYFYWIVSIILSYAKVLVTISIRFSEKTKNLKVQVLNWNKCKLKFSKFDSAPNKDT
jgi:hypothetical protein